VIGNGASAIKTGLLFAVGTIAIFVGSKDAIQIFLRIGAVNNMLVRVLVVLSRAGGMNFMRQIRTRYA
jgi:hypothetical protein